VREVARIHIYASIAPMPVHLASTLIDSTITTKAIENILILGIS
jgi:hypothetical protein